MPKVEKTFYGQFHEFFIKPEIFSSFSNIANLTTFFLEFNEFFFFFFIFSYNQFHEFFIISMIFFSFFLFLAKFTNFPWIQYFFLIFCALTVWKNEIFTLTGKKFRQINYLVISLVNPLLSRNFCQNIFREINVLLKNFPVNHFDKKISNFKKFLWILWCYFYLYCTTNFTNKSSNQGLV